MDTENFQHIVGTALRGETANIRFSGKITETAALQFCNEFDYLECCIRPKLIRVLINSEGGSVLHGMTVYSVIQNATVPTECVIEGMAASMASIVWAAGRKSLMRDYSILMIHNPFLPAENGEKAPELVEAFTRQITTVYRKRFGLKKEQVEAIMKGEAGRDGTFFDAKAAVKAGIIPQENIIHTSKQFCDKVKNEISGLEDISEIQAVLSRISAEVKIFDEKNKLFFPSGANLFQNSDNHQKMNEEKNNFEYATVAASLGLTDGYGARDVMSRISALVAVEARLTETAKALSDAQTVIAGKEAAIQNLQRDNGELSAGLKVYQDREAEEKKAKIRTLVEAAVADGRIDKTAETQWVQMAEANFALVENTLNSIPVPDRISREIALDPENVQAAAAAVQNAAKTVEEKISEQVNAVVGENFQFGKLK
jgi:ATP-dependent protease ClpP protease subunit